ncbi:DUF5696 domain-containing protein [bacterium]|nr:DUF5696 domain-containing protein [bacterium]
MRAAILLLLAVTAPALAAPVVPIPPGETSLLDIGIYRVGYQSYGGEVVMMPDSWVGHFEPVAGISYLPGDTVLGRKSLLLHSPWHIPPGRTFADYPLELPDLKPLALRFGIAMRPDVAAPDKSDGVTFSAFVITGDKETELFRQHQAEARWDDKTFDLSAYAGQKIVLRLQVEPGPAKSPSFDYSYWGDPKVVAGSPQTSRAELLRSLLAQKAYRATADADLRALSNNPAAGVTPSNLLKCTNRIVKSGTGYDFIYEGADAKVVLQYRPQTGTLSDFTCVVDEGPAFVPASEGGVFAETKEGDRVKRVLLTGGKQTPVLQGSALQVACEYPLAGQTVAVRWTFGMVGKALTVRAQCDQPVLVGLSLGRVTQAPLRRTVPVPYLPYGGALFYLPSPGVYVCRYLNWKTTHASTCPGGEANYDPKTDGTRNPLLEEGYVAVSPTVGEVLPNIPWQPSPYLKLLGDRIMLDVWGHHKGTFEGSADNLRDLKDNGVDHVAIINHVWQRFGYDVKLPDHVPANPKLGGDEGMIAFGKAANDCGYVWSVHENYIDLYPDAPSYDETACVLRANGTKSLAWYNPGTKVQSFGLKCNRARGFAEQNSPVIHKTYGTTAGYLDVHTCVPPWHQLDHQADQPMAAMCQAKVKYDGELFQYMRDTHGGPMFGEGANHLYWAGRCDGVEAQVAGGEDHRPLLELDLLKLHPQMVNHGMGYYERWFAEGRNSGWGHTVGNVEDVDKYRAQELAYGHAGFIGSISTDNVQWVAKEHHLCHPIQALYGTAKPVAIGYEVEGQIVPASIALAVGDTSRQCIKYDSGLKLWVNWRAEPWKIGPVTLPQWGFWADGPQTNVWTALYDGKLADYADCPEYVFADARTSFDMPYRRAAVDVEPRLKELKPLGGNRFAITYEWIVNAKLEDDYHCFVHFTNEKTTSGNADIAFQGDHAPPKPTSQWQPGERIVDGPYEVAVPDGPLTQFDINIGLYKQHRVSLKGPNAGGQRILLGALDVTREGEKATSVRLADSAERMRQLTVTALDFTAHMNPPGTMVDFGKIATDGAVKVNREKTRLAVFPYPRERQFTVTLFLPALAPGAKSDWRNVQVRALAAGTQTDMGKVEAKLDRGRLTWQCGGKGVGRYVVTW